MDMADNLEHGTLPDPEGQLIDELTRRIEQLETQVRVMSDELRAASVSDRPGKVALSRRRWAGG
jgi:hypothetical protein